MHLGQRLNRKIGELGLEKYLGEDVSFSLLRRTLQRAMTPFKIHVRLSENGEEMKVLKKTSAVSYSGWFEPGKVDYDITVVIHPPKGETALFLDESALRSLKFNMSWAAQHELIHRDQAKASVGPYDAIPLPIIPSPRWSKLRKENVAYLNDAYEVEAWGHDLAMEIREYYPEEMLATILNTIDRRPLLVSYRIWKKVFEGTNWPMVQSHLLSAVTRWYPEAYLPD